MVLVIFHQDPILARERLVIDNYFAPRTTPEAQPSIKSVLTGKEKKWRVDMSVAR